jgi:hypothetical protein
MTDLKHHRRGPVALGAGDLYVVWCQDCERDFVGANDVEAAMAWYECHDPDMADMQRALFDGEPPL